METAAMPVVVRTLKVHLNRKALFRDQFRLACFISDAQSQGILDQTNFTALTQERAARLPTPTTLLIDAIGDFRGAARSLIHRLRRLLLLLPVRSGSGNLDDEILACLNDLKSKSTRIGGCEVIERCKEMIAACQASDLETCTAILPVLEEDYLTLSQTLGLISWMEQEIMDRFIRVENIIAEFEAGSSSSASRPSAPPA